MVTLTRTPTALLTECKSSGTEISWCTVTLLEVAVGQNVSASVKTTDQLIQERPALLDAL